MLSKEQAEEFAAAHEEFIEATEEAERRYREITGCEYWCTDIVYLEDGEVHYKGEEYRGYGDYIHHSNSLPLRALFDGCWWEELEAEKREKDRKERRAAQRKKSEAARRKREKELRTLAELRDKYPEEAAAGA